MFSARRLPWFLAVVLIASAVALAGCGKKGASEKLAEGMMEKTLERATGGDVDLDIGGGGDNVTIKTEDGITTMSETTEWPTDMFTDLPKFTYGQVERVHRTRNNQNAEQGMTIWITGVEEGAIEKYSKDLEGAGWQSQMTIASGEGGMVSAQKGNLGLTVAYNYEEKTAALNVFSGAEE